MKKIYLIFFLSSFIFYPKTYSLKDKQNNFKINFQFMNHDSINPYISEVWKNDSLGCLEKRIIYVDSVIYYINNYIHSYSELIKYFGKPNYLSSIEMDSTLKEYTVDSTINARYNTFSLCDKKRNDSVLYIESWVLITFYGFKDTSFFAFHMLD